MTTLTRRSFLAASGVGTIGLVTGLGTSISMAAPGVPNDGDVLVVLFLRGGMDGLSLTPPITDSSYYQQRPNIAIPQPGQANGALALNQNGNVSFSSGFEGAFGLHPSAKALHDGLWKAGKLAFIPGTGFDGASFSHFRAMKNNFRGSLSTSVGGGWMGRMTNAQGGPGPVAAVHTSNAGDLLAGSNAAMGINNASQFRLNSFRNSDGVNNALAAAYGGNDSLSVEGRNILALSDRIASLDNSLRPGYSNDTYGKAFNQLGTLLNGSPTLGVRTAALATGGWDHHRNLGLPGDAGGRFHSRIKQLSDAVQTFSDETNGLQGITLVVTTEFGRTTNENGNRGTDHGMATTMMVAGGGIRGGVYGDDFADSLAVPSGQRRGAVPIMTDFRKPISEIVRKRSKLANTGSVFPGFTANGSDLGLA